MLFLMNNGSKKKEKNDESIANVDRVKELFRVGRFPVVTTSNIEGRKINKVLGLVACRGYDSEEAFFGMTARAVNKGAQAIVGYVENVAFHPDGSKFFSCYGTAVQFDAQALPSAKSVPAQAQTQIQGQAQVRAQSFLPGAVKIPAAAGKAI